VILPTLDSPLPENKSAIWCCSFQLAWDELKTKVVQEPIQLNNADAISDRLNHGEFSRDLLPNDSYYATAGWNRDGVRDRIRADMKRLFPNDAYPDLGDGSDGATAFAFLKTGLEFDTPYDINPEPLKFKDRAGNETEVRSMGFVNETKPGKARRQMTILHHREARAAPPISFAIDLCATSKPNQLILAVIDRQATLQEMLADLEDKIAADSKHEFGPTQSHPGDNLLVPCMKWKLNHHFKELEGPDIRFRNAGLKDMYLETALQTIEFRLDGAGVAVSSSSRIEVKSREPADFYFNRPFLVVLKKRDAKVPFFVMWVDNAELLERP
jgi:hypothetical protein